LNIANLGGAFGPSEVDDGIVNCNVCDHCTKGKGKLVPFLLLTEHHAMKAYWESGGIAPRILDPRRADQVVIFTPRLLYPQRESFGTHSIGGWVEPVWTRW